MEKIIGRIAGKSHGVVTRSELLQAGVSRKEIEHRLGIGALIREYPTVYRAGHRAPSVEAAYLAAVRACGEGAVLCGRAAGHLLGLLRGKAPAPEVSGRGKRRVRGVRTRRLRVDVRETSVVRGIPVTTVPRTLVDLAAELSVDDLARACHEAGVKYRTTPAEVEAVLARRPNVAGAARLRSVLRGDAQVTLSKLEHKFLELVSTAGLPRPETNRPAGTKRVDCRWPEPPLTVELDSYRFHNSRHSWEQDRVREREARRRGDEFRRYTYTDVFEDSGDMLAELARLLALASG